MKNAISVWMCQIIAARCRKRNIRVISGLFRTLGVTGLGQRVCGGERWAYGQYKTVETSKTAETSEIIDVYTVYSSFVILLESLLKLILSMDPKFPNK